MSCAEKSNEFTFPKDFVPLNPTASIHELKKTRPRETMFITSILDENPNEFKLLKDATVQKGKVALNGEHFVELCCEEQRPFSWLLEQCVEILPWNSILMKKLLSLAEEYSPIEVSDNLNDVFEINLGSPFEIELTATGNPQPLFQWFKTLPCSGDTFERLNNTACEDVLALDSFLLDDIGTYYCFVYHVLDVADPLPYGQYSKKFELKAKPGSIFIKSQSESCTLSLGSEVYLSIEAISTDELAYQWKCDDVDIPDGCSNQIKLAGTLSSEGSYTCMILNSINSTVSNPIEVRFNYPSPEELRTVPLATNKINILYQPSFDASLHRLGVGDVVHLKVVAACTNPLTYEWIRQGFNRDVTEYPNQTEKVTEVVRLVETSHELADEIPKLDVPVKYWSYQCVITNAREMEKVYSNVVKVPVSNFRSNKQALPTFKIALVICQEVYEDSEAYCRLNACKNDGQDLVWKLREMGFRVISFVNLTVQEARNAIELFCSMIDHDTYAVFYINGHAMSTECGLVFPCYDTRSSAPTVPIMERFLLQREVENKISQKFPLLLVLIYDSCRIDSTEDTSSITEKPPEMGTINFIRSFGTRQSMVNFDVTYSRQKSKGTFMKYLLKHIDSHETLGTAFEKLTDDFKRNEDQSVTNKMMPMYENCLTQEMKLTSELRDGKFGPLDSHFFSKFAYEALRDLSFKECGHEFLVDMALLAKKENEPDLDVFKSDKNGSRVSPIASIIIKILPSSFDNETNVRVVFKGLPSAWTAQSSEDFILEIAPDSLQNVIMNPKELIIKAGSSSNETQFTMECLQKLSVNPVLKLSRKMKNGAKKKIRKIEVQLPITKNFPGLIML